MVESITLESLLNDTAISDDYSEYNEDNLIESIFESVYANDDANISFMNLEAYNAYDIIASSKDIQLEGVKDAVANALKTAWDKVKKFFEWVWKQICRFGGWIKSLFSKKSKKEKERIDKEMSAVADNCDNINARTEELKETVSSAMKGIVESFNNITKTEKSVNDSFKRSEETLEELDKIVDELYGNMDTNPIYGSDTQAFEKTCDALRKIVYIHDNIENLEFIKNACAGIKEPPSESEINTANEAMSKLNNSEELAHIDIRNFLKDYNKTVDILNSGAKELKSKIDAVDKHVNGGDVYSDDIDTNKKIASAYNLAFKILNEESKIYANAISGYNTYITSVNVQVDNLFKSIDNATDRCCQAIRSICGDPAKEEEFSGMIDEMLDILKW